METTTFKKDRLYEYKCSKCKKVEYLKYKTFFYRNKYGTGFCNSCSKKGGNQTSFKVGSVPHNKGKRFPLGEKHHNWKGGITPVIQKIRRCPEYHKWRNSVFKRDNYTCVICLLKNKKNILNADHYPKMFHQVISDNNIDTYEKSKFCKELWDINNGRTLCVECHYKETSKQQKQNWVNQYSKNYENRKISNK